ncbi:MAG TPA: ubiquitin-like small modifier protein 1 [Methanocella sp.]|jgi:molybdopterin synthase sulfur carrier subunit
MKVKFKLFANFREAARGKEVELEIKGDTVDDAIQGLLARYPALAPMTLQDGKIKPYVNILLNAQKISSTEGLMSHLKDNDEIALFPPVSGG